MQSPVDSAATTKRCAMRHFQFSFEDCLCNTHSHTPTQAPLCQQNRRTEDRDKLFSQQHTHTHTLEYAGQMLKHAFLNDEHLILKSIYRHGQYFQPVLAYCRWAGVSVYVSQLVPRHCSICSPQSTGEYAFVWLYTSKTSIFKGIVWPYGIKLYSLSLLGVRSNQYHSRVCVHNVPLSSIPKLS